MADSTTQDVEEKYVPPVSDDKTNGKTEPETAVSSATEVKEEPKVKIEDLEAKIIRQVEYYFGDHNLGRDKFMQEKLKLDEGWITLETLITFNRLRELSDDFKVIVGALRKSTSGLVMISEDESKLRRNPEKPLPVFNTQRKQDLRLRSVYVKGFPLDSVIDDLLKFFDDHGSTENIQMRRDEKRDFKGSCFVVFKTVEDANKFNSAESIKYKDVELIKMLKDTYYKSKKEAQKGSALEDVKKLEEEKQRLLEEEKEKQMESIVKGAILHLTGLGDETTREEIKETFKDCEIAWVDFETGDKEAWVRFDVENMAEKAYKAALVDGKLKINEAVVEGKVLEGDDEKEHWKNVFKQKRDHANRKNTFSRKRGGGRFRGGGPARKRNRRN